MNFLLRTWATLLIAVRRVMAQRWLAIATILGLVAAITLIMSIPLYADAVYYRVLQDELTKSGQGVKGDPQAFAFVFRNIGSIYGVKEWNEIEPVDAYLSGPAPQQLGLPVKNVVRYVKTDNFRLFPANTSQNYANAQDPLEWVSFGALEQLEEHVIWLEGVAPAPASTDPADPIEVAVSGVLAETLGIQVGEEFLTFRNMETDAGQRTVQLPVRVSGIWAPIDPEEGYWFYRPRAFDEQLLVPFATFEGRISSLLKDEVALMVWYWVVDGSNVTAADAPALVARIDQVSQRAATLLPNTRLDSSPYDALKKYQASAQLLTVLLYAFSIPIVALLLAFIGLVVGLAVSRQRNEIAVLRSRGATAIQIAAVAMLEAAVLGLIALVVAVPLSAWVAQAFGATRSFLNFSLDSNLRIQVTASPVQFGLIAVGVTLLAQVLPSIGAARHTIVSYKQELARTVSRPWWQRAWLDVLLLIPAVYGIYLVRQQGTILTPAGASAGDIFENPLLILLPALVALALTLLILRLLPMLMALIAWLAARTSSVGFLLATRYLAREPGLYSTPLVLLMLTLGLSVFTASLAQTLDNHLFDQSYYTIGADARLVELGAAANAGESAFGSAGFQAAGQGEATPAAAPTEQSAITEITGPEWVFIPVGEHLNVKEIEAATRVGKFDAAVQMQDRWQPVTMIGVDRVDFPQVAFWRRDFASASLGALMNSLAIASDGVLIERSFMRQQGLRVGDAIQLRLNAANAKTGVPMRIVGDFRYFPTWYSPEEEGKPLMVANLDWIFEQTGGERPYDVWIKTTPAIDFEQMVHELRTYEISVLDYQASSVRIAEELRRPERQGLFGVLSVGFLASALLTVLGFLLYALFSFRRRFIELGTLRAIGLSTRQLAIFLSCELAFLILLGLGAGTGIGALISELFIPYFQIGSGPAANIPPFTVEIAWFAVTRLYMLFGVLFFVAFMVLIVLLLRMKVFQAIKLGETV
ncbi:MAG: FtsX-like permease family protein [Caldilineaceae bacterium]|jgi:putative ABC transport system permease protein|nr:FtsX-like permease family protein [Caldilineaceae bacterium]